MVAGSEQAQAQSTNATAADTPVGYTYITPDEGTFIEAVVDPMIGRVDYFFAPLVSNAEIIKAAGIKTQ
jgi:hypothetical protein